jgi:WD40 repeat protein
MQEMTNRGLRVAWVGAMAAALLLAGCGDPPPAAGPKSPAVALRGTVLAAGQPFGLGLRSWGLPGLRAADLTEPRDEWEIQTYLGARWTADGTAVAFAGTEQDDSFRAADSRLYEFDVGTAPRPLGQTLFAVSGFSLTDELALATTCPRPPGRVLVLQLGGAARWREVARSCVAALSPGGDRVAFLKGRWEVWERRLDGGKARRVVDLARVPGLRSGEASRVGASSLTWGEAGVAVQIGDPGGFDPSSRSKLVVVRSDGEVVAVPIADQSILLPASGWRPGGELLAFITRPSSGGALVRLFDPSSGDVRVVAADSQLFSNVVWSPDGRALVASTSNNVLVFFDTEGNWIRRAAGGGVAVFDWAPP